LFARTLLLQGACTNKTIRMLNTILVKCSAVF
jgi:hypothetical protein